MSEHDPLCPAVNDRFRPALHTCQCELIARVVEREKQKADLAISFWVEHVRAHHYVEMQGGRVPRCCLVCKTHVRGHPICVLNEDYDGPLPEGHRYEE